MRFEDQQKWMVKHQMIDQGISDENVLSAFLKVPRHLFVPADIRHLAYENSPLGIGEGQTISQPFTVAYMMQLAELKSDHSVLEIGTGSGYQTALLAEIVKEVYSVERISFLSNQAKEKLADLNYQNIFYQISDGTLGWKTDNSRTFFDRIIVTAAAPEIPQSLVEQLKIGGKMVIPAGGKFSQTMYVIEKQINNINTYSYGNFTFVPLIGQEGWKI